MIIIRKIFNKSLVEIHIFQVQTKIPSNLCIPHFSPTRVTRVKETSAYIRACERIYMVAGTVPDKTEKRWERMFLKQRGVTQRKGISLFRFKDGPTWRYTLVLAFVARFATIKSSDWRREFGSSTELTAVISIVQNGRDRRLKNTQSKAQRRLFPPFRLFLFLCHHDAKKYTRFTANNRRRKEHEITERLAKRSVTSIPSFSF